MHVWERWWGWSLKIKGSRKIIAWRSDGRDLIRKDLRIESWLISLWRKIGGWVNVSWGLKIKRGRIVGIGIRKNRIKATWSRASGGGVR